MSVHKARRESLMNLLILSCMQKAIFVIDYRASTLTNLHFLPLNQFFNHSYIILEALSLKFIRLLRVVVSSQQRLNRPAVNAVQ